MDGGQHVSGRRGRRGKRSKGNVCVRMDRHRAGPCCVCGWRDVVGRRDGRALTGAHEHLTSTCRLSYGGNKFYRFFLGVVIVPLRVCRVSLAFTSSSSGASVQAPLGGREDCICPPRR